jgi:type IV pilus assembly protein PilO
LPIKLRARGDYHSFGKFISGIASMNRIVTIHDVSIAPATGGPTSASDKATLTMELMAQIYRYVENAEEPAKPGAAKPGTPPPPPKK